jgi:glyoxylase I family protein
MTTQTTDFEARCEALRQKYLKPAGERPATTVRGVHHLAMICSDVEQTIQFYQEVLGFPLVELFENRDYKGSTHFFLDIGNGNLLAFFDFPGLGLKPGVESIGSVQHVAISIESEQFEMLKGRLDAQGVEYLGPDRGLSGSMYFKDPNGIQIELLNEPLREMGGRRMGD